MGAPDSPVVITLPSWLAVCFVLALCGFPVMYQVVTMRSRRSLAVDGYKDADGQATPETLKQFSNRGVFAVILVVQTLQIVSSVILLVLAKQSPFIKVPYTPVPVLTGLYIICLAHTVLQWTLCATDRSRTRSILCGIGLNAIAFTTIWVTLEPDPRPLFTQHWIRKHASEAIFIISATSQYLLVAVYCSCQLALSRRPGVYAGGRPVDRQRSSSLWGLITFSWAAHLLRLASKKQSLEFDDLPRLPSSTRTANLQTRLETALQSRGLLRALISVHYPALILQQILTVTTACMSFAPQVALLGILKSLERIQAQGSNSWVPIPWVLILGGFMVLNSLLESWLYWLVISKIAIPVREQLSAVIYAKAMRCQAPGRAARKTETSSSNDDEVEVSGEIPKKDEDPDPLRLEKSTVNLAAVDAKRVSDEAAYNYMMTTVILKFGVACIFLVSLLGWLSTLAGLSLTIIVTPVNIHIGRRFTNAQANLMALRDQRVTVLGEALREIRQVKLSAQENRWQTRVSIIRRAELDAQWKCFFYDICLLTICLLSPIALSVISLGVYALLNDTLPASVAFTAIPVFGSLEMSLANLPDMLSSLMEAFISVRRIESYLKTAEKEINLTPSENGPISFVNAAVAYPAGEDVPLEERFVLHKLSFEFPSGGLSIVSGKTGSGKSLVLSAILGESDLLGGFIKVPQRPGLDAQSPNGNWVDEYKMAFVSQAPWIENTSVRDNVLFGLPFHQERYQQVISDCALSQDIDTFPDKDMTKIGANGINISGGQRWRISLARALYSRAGTILLDDVFSAVDTHTARHLCDNALLGPLAKNRTRILVTHHLELCGSRANFIVTLGDDGTVLRTSTNDKISPTGSPTPTLVSSLGSDDSYKDSILGSPNLTSSGSDYLHLIQTLDNESEENAYVSANHMEKRETGAVKLRVYQRYLQAGGSYRIWIAVLTVYMAYMFLGLGRSWWINIWTAAQAASERTNATYAQEFQRSSLQTPLIQIGNYTIQGQGNSLAYYLSIYVLISMAAFIAGSVRNYFVLSASIRASRELFDRLLFNILHAPIQWLNHVPVGRILNRFSVDFALIDSKLGYDLSSMLHRFFEVLGIAVSGLFASPLTIIFSLLPVAGGFYYAPLYLVAAREIKRLESTAISPVFEQFESSLIGLSTIRAFAKTSDYITRMHRLLDQHAQAMWHLWLFNRWFNLRMNLVGALYCVLTAGLVVLHPEIGPSVAGFTLSFTIQYPAAILWCIRQYTNVELSMNSAERVIEYEDIEVEDQGGNDAPDMWPQKGQIEVRNLTTGYGELPPVLRDVNFTVQPGKRIGVVGRTGAGKSSLTLALFRFLEARSGSIMIDGVDISTLRLEELRGKLQVIPQDPVLFSGTVRSNLDPMDEHSDEELYSALKRTHLIPPETGDDGLPANIASRESNFFASLSSVITEGGSGLSVGQRQLLNLCRVLLSRPKIVILDEATSAVDMATDALVQQLIRDEAARNGTTLLVIAHRLSTIADFDAIVVMDTGRVVEYGPARELVGIERGVFRSMVEESGDSKTLREKIFKLE